MKMKSRFPISLKGNYTICVSSFNNIDFERCYTTELVEPDPLSVATQLNATDLSVTIELSGDKTIGFVSMADDYIFKTGRHHLALRAGLNRLEVTTDLSCQAKLVREIYVSENSSLSQPCIRNR